MIGDLILFINKLLKQTFCLHKYTWKGKLDFRYQDCDKCGRLKP